MTRLLDVLEDYFLYRGYKYCRIDGAFCFKPVRVPVLSSCTVGMQGATLCLQLLHRLGQVCLPGDALAFWQCI